MKSEQPIRIDVQFRHMPKLAAIANLVKVEVIDLERFALPGTHCEVVVDGAQQRHLGSILSVRIRLVIPGEGIYIAHRSACRGSIENIYSAVTEGFEELQSQLRKRNSRKLRRQRREMAA